MSKIPVYLMPGLAASAAIFERIALPEAVFEIVLLEWEIPLDQETLPDYAKRMTEKIKHPNPVLIGVSFGGILVQEMAAFVQARKVIIISSVKSNLEFPRRMKIAKTTKAYKLIPMSLILNIENLAKFSFGTKVNQRLKLYEKFLSVRDIRYLDWAIEKVILWDRTVANKNVIHIHGDADDVFPIKYISDCIVVKGGTHIMILNKYKWLNANLPEIILGTNTNLDQEDYGK
jgi:pimeloyl-ACP methyl ester carboxylesterase